MISRFLGNLLAIKPNEWDGVLYFFLVLLVFSFGASFARSIGMTLLVQHLGGDKLPIIFISIDLAVMVGSILYAHYTKKTNGVTILRFFLLSTTGFAVVIQFLFFITSFNNLEWPWVYGFFFVGFSFFYILISIHVGSVIASYFTAVQVKRLTAVINAGLPIGGMLGGSTLIVFLKIFHIQPQHLIIVLGWACLGAFGLLHLINTRLSPVRVSRAESKSHKNPFDELVAAFKYIINSKLMIFMSLGLMLFVIGNKLLEYQYQTIIYFDIYPNATQRASFFATYEVFANLIWLIIQLFLTSRIILTLGVGASNLLYPALSALVALALFIFFYLKFSGQIQGDMLMMLILGMTTQFVNQEMRGALRTPANNLLFNAIPPNLWGINKAFLNGIVYPFSTLMAGTFLIIIAEAQFSIGSIDLFWTREQQSYLLPSIVLGTSILGILVALPQWSAYNQGVFGLLNRELFGRHSEIRASGRSHALKGVLDVKLRSDDQYHVIAALEMIRVLRLGYFVTQVGELLLKTQLFQVKERCINTLAALPQSSAGINFLVEALKSEQNAEALPLLLKNLAQFKTLNINELVEKFLTHPAPKVLVEACLFLYNHPLYQAKSDIEKKLLTRLQQAQVNDFPVYLQGLGELRQRYYSDLILPYLDCPQPQVRLAAFTAYVRMQEGYLQQHKTRLLEALQSSDKEMKIVALRALKECTLDEESEIEWTSIISLLGAKDRVLVNESKELLRLSLGSCKGLLYQQVFSTEVPVQQRFEVLSLMYPRLTEEQKRQLRDQADLSLKQFVEINGLLRLHLASKSTSKVYDLITKILQEIAENHLLQVLTVITFAADKNLDFFQRISRGLFSTSRANQGNALEVLSNAEEKYLSARILKYFEEERSTGDVQAINRIYWLLFDEVLKTNDKNQEMQLIALNHDMLKACLFYVEMEKTQGINLDQLDQKVRQFF